MKKSLNEIVAAAQNMNVVRVNTVAGGGFAVSTGRTPMEITDGAMARDVANELAMQKNILGSLEQSQSIINLFERSSVHFDGDLPDLQDAIDTTDAAIEEMDAALTKWEDAEGLR